MQNCKYLQRINLNIIAKNINYILLIFSILACLGSSEIPQKTKGSNQSASSISILDLKIDSIVNKGISDKAFPGCQVLVMKDGQVYFEKSYGYYTYDKKQQVTDSTLYDLASLSKTTGTLLAIMKLYDAGKIKLDEKASKYLTFLKNTDKENITITDLLFHETGLPGSMFFYRWVYEKNNGLVLEMNAAKPAGNTYKYKEGYTSNRYTANYTLQAGDSLFLNNKFHQEAMEKIALTKLGPKTYLYSCVNFILLKEIVEQVSKMRMDSFLTKNFYEPMGLRHIAYLPLRIFPKSEIAPTMKKDFLRNETLQGYVHDPDAAFLGGVSGNAGLFASATDVASVYQMILNNGIYNDKRYLSEKTCQIFTTKTSASARRGLGFDKPVPSNPRINPCSELAPQEVFGHTGYTGTCCWVDPVNKLIYVFLSNRTYPDDSENKLAKFSIRPKIQTEIYKTIHP